jgi:CBS domain containing-hemolysin-like protein
MGVSLPTEDSDTLGGFIYTELGKVPVVGDHVIFEDLDFTVESVAGRRIMKVRVARQPTPVSEDQEAGAEPPRRRNGNGDGNGNGKGGWHL